MPRVCVQWCVSRVCVCVQGVCVCPVCMHTHTPGSRGTPPDPEVHRSGPSGRHLPRPRGRYPPVDRQTSVKTLPCPKLRLQAVKMWVDATSSPRPYSDKFDRPLFHNSSCIPASLGMLHLEYLVHFLSFTTNVETIIIFSYSYWNMIFNTSYLTVTAAILNCYDSTNALKDKF